jgi:hypothetical protein
MGIRLKSVVFVAVIAAALAFVLLNTREAAATLYCGRPYSQLLPNPGKPYNAVGLLNNGCTAFLIDASHIAAAAHCFENTSTGNWFTGLRFYPNFHPSRVTADPYHVPRADVLRVVVGSRAGESLLGSGMDWAIARIGPWKDAAGLDLTPLALSRTMPANGTPLSNPAYTRHHFPYDDNDSVTWDNMQWDNTSCGWVQPNNGMWAVKRRAAPFYNGVDRDLQGCNSRWAAGYIHTSCSLTKVVNGVVVHNCDTIGGSSGSPVMYKDGLGTWRVIGVGHGGGSSLTASSNDFGQLAPACSADTPENSDNVAASSQRFVDAPRFASNVAVHRSPYSPSATAVFAVDSDLNRVVYRYRIGTLPTYTSHFTYWKNLGAPLLRSVKLSRIAACSANSQGSPQFFVVANQSSIYTRSADLLGNWSGWSSFGLPASVTSVADLDAAQDSSGRCLLFMVSDAGAFVRARTSDTTWGNWISVAGGSYNRVTALNNSGVIWAALLDNSGEIWRTSRGRYGWAAPIKLSRPLQVTSWQDIDLTWDEYGRGFMLAIPAVLNGVVHGPAYSLWFTPLYGTQPWSQWLYFTNYLWAPGVRVQYPPRMRSITASRWMEDPAGTTSPVIFGTDDRGNVYLVYYSALQAKWDLFWKSFYHEYVPNP